jgi:hypothetical protein
MGRPFEYEVYLLIVVEEAIHFKDVRVVEVSLDLNFARQLSHAVVLEQLSFVQNLYGTNELGLLFPSEIDMTKFSSAEW